MGWGEGGLFIAAMPAHVSGRCGEASVAGRARPAMKGKAGEAARGGNDAPSSRPNDRARARP